jgi:hypothetical protein
MLEKPSLGSVDGCAWPIARYLSAEEAVRCVHHGTHLGLKRDVNWHIVVITLDTI